MPPARDGQAVRVEKPGTDVAPPRRDAPGAGPGGEERHALDVNGVQVCASALAAVTAAWLGSTFGVTGTVVGAAVASIVATVGSAVYGLWIKRTRERLRQVEVPTSPPWSPA